MDTDVKPVLVACHRRSQDSAPAASYRYIYGLWAFPLDAVSRDQAHFCIVVQRLDQSAGSGRGFDSELLGVSRTFHRSSDAALTLFETIAFARQPVSPHHIDDLVADCLGSAGPAVPGTCRAAEPQPVAGPM
ncbi:MAG: hypothetical protein WD535_03600 [Thermaerobacterales bacterium]